MMNSPLRYILLMAATMQLSGCLHEKYTYCPLDDSPNVRLAFEVPGDVDGTRFESSISSVYVAVFDEYGRYVTARDLDASALKRLRGIELTLEPGTYHAVGWSNLLENTAIEGITGGVPLRSHVTYRSKNGGRVGNADKVWYGPGETAGSRASSDISHSYLMVVDPSEGHDGLLQFREGYRTLRVYVEGYNGTPDVELAGIPEGLFCFGMTPLTDENGNPRTVTARSSTTPAEVEGKLYEMAGFDTFRFGWDNNIVINVIDRSSGDIVFTLPLNEALEDPSNMEEIIISIIFKFTPAGIEVSVPQWNREEIDPGVTP